MAEAFFATLECELLDRRRFRSRAEARIAVFPLIKSFYNPARRHSALGDVSPVAYEARPLLTNADRYLQTVHESGQLQLQDS